MKFNVAWSIVGIVLGLSGGAVFYEVLNSYIPLTEYNKLKYAIYDSCRDKKHPRTILVPGSKPSNKCECVAIYGSEFAYQQGVAGDVAEDLLKNKSTVRSAYIINTARGVCEYRNILLGQ
jgi:hypothetical protein